MPSIYEKTQGTVIQITKLPFDDTADKILINGKIDTTLIWADGSCATNEISYQGGQKTDIDVTSLCSTQQEVTNGLAAPAELTLTRNWAENDPMLAELEEAYDLDQMRAFQVIFPSGNGFVFTAEVRQNSWSVATAGKVSASYTLRLRGNPIRVRSTATAATLKSMKAVAGTGGTYVNGVLTISDITNPVDGVELTISAAYPANSSLGTLTPKITGPNSSLFTVKPAKNSSGNRFVVKATGATNAGVYKLTFTSDVASSYPLEIDLVAIAHKPKLITMAAQPGTGATLTGNALVFDAIKQNVDLTVSAVTEVGADLGVLSADFTGPDAQKFSHTVNGDVITVTADDFPTGTGNELRISSDASAAVLDLDLDVKRVLKALSVTSADSNGVIALGALTIPDYTKKITLKVVADADPGAAIGTITVTPSGADSALFGTPVVDAATGEVTFTMSGVTVATDNKLTISTDVANVAPLELTVTANSTTVVPVLKSLDVVAGTGATLTGDDLAVSVVGTAVELTVTAKDEVGADIGELDVTAEGTDAGLFTVPSGKVTNGKVSITASGETTANDNKIVIKSNKGTNVVRTLNVTVKKPAPVLKKLKVVSDAAAVYDATAGTLVIKDHATPAKLTVSAEDEVGAAFGTLSVVVDGTDKAVFGTPAIDQQTGEITISPTGIAKAADNTITISTDVANVPPLVLSVTAPAVLKTLNVVSDANATLNLTAKTLVIKDHSKAVNLTVTADTEAGAAIGKVTGTFAGPDAAKFGTSPVTANASGVITFTPTAAVTAAGTKLTIKSDVAGVPEIVLDVTAPAVLKTMKAAIATAPAQTGATFATDTLTIANHTTPAAGIIMDISAADEAGASLGTLTATPGATATADAAKIKATVSGTKVTIQATAALAASLGGKVTITSSNGGTPLVIKVVASA